jgi:hypothetical protein
MPEGESREREADGSGGSGYGQERPQPDAPHDAGPLGGSEDSGDPLGSDRQARQQRRIMGQPVPSVAVPRSRSSPADADDLAAHHMARHHGNVIGANHRSRGCAGGARHRSLGAHAGTSCAHSQL